MSEIDAKTEQALDARQQIEAWIDGEKRALSGDDPSSLCAAYHRGAINAYSNVLRRLDEENSDE